MKNIKVFHRPFGGYKTIQVQCNVNNDDYLEVTKYPDDGIVVSMNTTMPDDDIILSIEQLEKLVEELNA